VGEVPLSVADPGSPSNTKQLFSVVTLSPKITLVYLSIWPQYTNITDVC